MADIRPTALSKAMSTKQRAELYRAFLEDDAQSLRIIIRHAGHCLFLRAKPEDEASGQVGKLLTALAETERHFGSPRDIVWHGDSLFQQIRNVFGDTTYLHQ
jgi:hypothetical protein